jgi:hypothetical protein
VTKQGRGGRQSYASGAPGGYTDLNADDPRRGHLRYYTGIDPFTKELVHIAHGQHDRKLQRALMLFLKPEYYFAVREALTRAGRPDLIGDGCDHRPGRKSQERRTKPGPPRRPCVTS